MNRQSRIGVPVLGWVAWFSMWSGLCPAATHYVSSSGSHASPFLSWANAATNIQDAVDIAAEGDVVRVTNGVYAAGGRPAPGYLLTNRVTVQSPIIVESVNGPDWTIIRGRGPEGPDAVRCAFLTNGAVLSGFRLENGSTIRQWDGSNVLDMSGGGALLFGGCLLTNCQAVSNTADHGDGGGVALIGDGRLTHCVMTGNSATEGGGVYAIGGVLLQCRLNDNASSPGFGGGAYVQTGVVQDCTFVGNNGYLGGGFYMIGGWASNITAISNMAARGGGIWLKGSTAQAARLEGNTVYDGGGGARLENSRLREGIVSNNDLTWQGLSGNSYGAGLYAVSSIIERCEIVNNWGPVTNLDGGWATNFGGGIAAGDQVTIRDETVIKGNQARYGGGIYVMPGGQASLGNYSDVCAVLGNRAHAQGGGAYVSPQAILGTLGALAMASNCAQDGGGVYVADGGLVSMLALGAETPVLFDNVASNAGGGICATGSQARIFLDGVQVGRTAGVPQGNAALGSGEGGGGGIALYDGASLNGKNLRVEQNRCSRNSGGGILLRRAEMNLTSDRPNPFPNSQPQTLFMGNSATGYNGGAIYSFQSKISIANAAFYENRAARGGAIHVDSRSTGTLANLVIHTNLATESGAGVRVYGANTRCALQHCTIIANSSGGVEAAGGAFVSLTNCIVRAHAQTNVTDGFPVGYSDIQGGRAGPGNLDADPFFRDASARDFRLTLDSTNGVVDGGANAGLTNDCIARARPQGDGYDMGAFEYHSGRDDFDGDGMADGWELEHNLDPRSDADGALDSDLDGDTNLVEYFADTNPRNSNDYFRLNDCYYNPARPDRGIFVGFMSSTDRVYSLYSSEDLLQPAWSAMTGRTNYQGAGSYDGLNDTNGLPARDYRVTVAVPPQ